MVSGVLTLFVAIWMACFPTSAAAETVTVFAASSLRDAVSDIADTYTEQTGDEVVLVFAASSAIARQVDRGAPADVVLLADQDWAHWLVDQGALDSAQAFASNALVIVAPIGTAPLTDISDLTAALKGGVLAMAQVDAVPAGRYGKAALEALGLWHALAGSVVQAPNVRAGLRFVQRGEAPLAIGYASDLVALTDLALIYEFARDTHPDIVYSGGGITPQGRAFMEYIQSPMGQEALMEWGFTPPPAPQ